MLHLRTYVAFFISSVSGKAKYDIIDDIPILTVVLALTCNRG